MKNKAGLVCVLLAAALLMSHSLSTYAAWEGNWGLSENGKNWMYFYSPDNPAKDQWIEDDGKEYYVDARGYMKTGWVTDKSTGYKYYMGKDGAKCFNYFTPDGRYVGPDGIVLSSFDTYRKAVKKQLSSTLKEYIKAEGDGVPGFCLADLNGDGYRDVVVANRVEAPDRLVMVAFWDTLEKKLKVSAEFDIKEGGETSFLTYNTERQSVWLKIMDKNGDNRNYFSVIDNDCQFENIWNFTVDMDDWGDAVYVINGQEVENDEWENLRRQAEYESGDCPVGIFSPLTEEIILQQTDQVPTQEDLPLWQD